MPLMQVTRGSALKGNTAGNTLYPLLSTGALTVANLITDVTRLAGVQGDGAAYPDSSVGVWPAATNLVANGGGTTNTTGWGSYPTGTIARTTSEAYFGTACLQFTPAALNDIALYTVNPVSAVTTYTASIWFKTPDSAITFLVDEFTAASAYVTTHATALSPSPNTWTKATLTFTTDATTGKVNIGLQATASTSVFYIDGVQLETGSIATPYIETDGGTASRSAGHIEMPASALDETQMWVAVRFRNGVNSSSTSPANQRYAFAFGDDGNNLLRIRQVYSTDVWDIARASGGSVTSRSLSGVTYAIDDTETIVGYWTSSLVGLSRNGAAFLTAANTYIPTLSATYATIGSARDAIQPSAQLASAVLWFAAGIGTLTDADAALFNSWGNNDPLPHMFPKSAQLTFLAHFNGDGTFYRRAA